jgi:hypothetical protein
MLLALGATAHAPLSLMLAVPSRFLLPAALRPFVFRLLGISRSAVATNREFKTVLFFARPPRRITFLGTKNWTTLLGINLVLVAPHQLLPQVSRTQWAERQPSECKLTPVRVVEIIQLSDRISQSTEAPRVFGLKPMALTANLRKCCWALARHM